MPPYSQPPVKDPCAITDLLNAAEIDESKQRSCNLQGLNFEQLEDCDEHRYLIHAYREGIPFDSMEGSHQHKNL